MIEDLLVRVEEGVFPGERNNERSEECLLDLGVPVRDVVEVYRVDVRFLGIVECFGEAWRFDASAGECGVDSDSATVPTIFDDLLFRDVRVAFEVFFGFVCLSAFFKSSAYGERVEVCPGSEDAD